MHYDISFPNLGIYLDHVGKNISIHGFTIAYYGIIIGIAILIGFVIATSEAKRTRQNPDDYLDMGIIGVIAGIAGARIYFVIFSWDLYKDNLLDIFNLREGGLAIYGGVIAAVIAVFVLAKVKKLSPFQILDTIALALLNGQMLGRWGNFFNREAFGEYTDGLFAMRLPLDAVRSGDVTELMREHMEVIDGVSYIQVHPTFRDVPPLYLRLCSGQSVDRRSADGPASDPGSRSAGIPGPGRMHRGLRRRGASVSAEEPQEDAAP